ncbi:MAG TPA: hypothetical protein VM287_06010 [Egibacteraceae bacterium]|nr:hypothetical protein [Egibacteraceae bacterium]
MNATEELSGFEARLLAELREVVEARPATAHDPDRRGFGRARRTVALVAAVTVLAVLAVLTPALLGSPRFTQPAFAVRTLPDGSVEVIVEEHFDEPTRLRQELVSHGVAVEVIEVAGSPSEVGKLSHLFVPEDAEGVEVRRSSPSHVWEFVVDPDRFDGAITLEIARAAQPGEHLYATGDAFAEGEPLEGLPCALGWPIDSAELARAAARVGLDVSWIAVTNVTDNSWGGKDAARRPDGAVFFAHLNTPETLQVSVLVPGTDPRGLPGKDWRDAGERYTSSCSPQTIDRWR